jgi:Ca2+-binding RTX toxin-like protein
MQREVSAELLETRRLFAAPKVVTIKVNDEREIKIKGTKGPDVIAVVEQTPGSTIFDVVVNGAVMQSFNAPSGVDLDGGGGDDTLTISVPGKSEIDGGPGNDVMTGSAAGQRLNGGGGNDTINGLGGNDILIGLGGADNLDGGDGDDILVGGGGSDTLTGGIGNDNLVGLGGADTINAGDGNDFINGGGATDILTGGPGADTFSKKGKDAEITDFAADDLRGVTPKPDIRKEEEGE